MTEPAIEMRSIEKRFGPVQALDGVDLVVMPGTIHGLVGANGAGKSTIIKILAGIYRPDGGTIKVAGQQITGITPASSEASGIYFIHQDRLLLVPAACPGECHIYRLLPTTRPFSRYSVALLP